MSHSYIERVVKGSMSRSGTTVQCTSSGLWILKKCCVLESESKKSVEAGAERGSALKIEASVIAEICGLGTKSAWSCGDQRGTS